MSAGGYFNHYDDPDEFWDDEPIRGPATREEPRVLDRTPIPAAISPDFFTMKLDSYRLPVDIYVAREVRQRVAPERFSEAALLGYYAALWRHDGPTIATGDFAALGARPPRRTEIVALLGTRTAAEFGAMRNVLRGREAFVGTGPPTEFGTPSMRVTASLSRIGTIDIDARWAASATPHSLAQDLLDCVAQIRTRRPDFTVMNSWNNLALPELERELTQHENFLRRKS